MKGWKVFAEIQELKKLGLKKSQVERKLKINYKTVDKYWDMSPEEYAKTTKEAKNRTKKLDKYKTEILEWINEFRDMSAAQVHDWLKEEYGEINASERTIRLYVASLRKEYNLPKVEIIRQYEEVPELPMGYQAQIDLGSIWLKRLDGSRIKLYCFAMVLSHSRYKFVWWSDKPFTTLSFIDMHIKAFEYLGGMPKEIVYDQDRLLAVDENFGDIIYTEVFQNYINGMKFKVRLCRRFDPESKGKVEAVVKYVKKNFADHRTYENLESFNELTLAWLERTGNAKVHEITKMVPAEVFLLERQHLTPVPKTINKKANNSLTYLVRKNNVVFYKQNRYQVPKGTYAPGKEVELIIKDNSMDIVDKETGELIATHPISKEKGKLIKLSHPDRQKDKTVDQVYAKAFMTLNKTAQAKLFLDNIRKEKSRYAKDQYTLITRSVVNYTAETIAKAVEYCVKRQLSSAGMFKDALEYLKSDHEKAVCVNPQDNPIPSKYQGLKPEIRSVSHYTKALGGIH